MNELVFNYSKSKENKIIFTKFCYRLNRYIFLEISTQLSISIETYLGNNPQISDRSDKKKWPSCVRLEGLPTLSAVICINKDCKKSTFIISITAEDF